MRSNGKQPFEMSENQFFQR